ncbi:MAG TPA: hypothetical protein VFW44_13050, partial [Bryobacteraceae bacterium]|nr:hypothetical protein [Bryobacteraceae bacterium]
MTRRAELGMAMFLIAAGVFFSLLILAVGYFRALPRLMAPPGWVLTALLLAASFAIWRGWRWVTVALGLAFCGVLFATAASMLTGLHALFILAGVIALAVVPASALRAMAL